MNHAAPLPAAPPSTLRLAQVRANAKGLRIGPLTLELGEGAHVVVADKQDGAGLLLGVLAGELSCSGNVVRRRGERIAYVSSPMPMPEELTAVEYLRAASSFRGFARSEVDTLARFALGAWAGVRISNLPEPERKALALAEALTSQATLLLLDSPLLGVSIGAARAIEDALFEAVPGRVCVFSTPFTSHAKASSASVLVLQSGIATFHGEPNHPVLRTSRYRVECSDPGKLFSLLRKAAGDALHLEVTGRTLFAEWRAHAIVPNGETPAPPPDLAKLLTSAAAEGSIDIGSMRGDTAFPEVVRARLALQMPRPS